LHSSKDLAVSPFHFTAFADYRKARPQKMGVLHSFE
jgi:hypothetical protein